ncbi:MAG: alpha-rhamnosidase [Clostridia bacterium]|nr:alpha-rhamnosidase [Clostridia bacterium]
MSKSKWIWHPGAFELYHSMLLHNRRTSAKTVSAYGKTERKSVFYAPMWRADGPQRNAELTKTEVVDRDETIILRSNTPYCCAIVDDKKYPPNTPISLCKGTHTIILQGFKADGFPAFYIEGNVFNTDRTWVTCNENIIKPSRNAGQSELYTSPCDNPEVFKFEYKKTDPVSVKSIDGGALYDFGREVFGKIVVRGQGQESYFLSLGESYEEALDVDFCQICVNATLENGEYVSESVAFRYIFIPNLATPLDIFVNFEYLPLATSASFECDDELINTLWKVCEYTMLLNSREGFFDGIKRDRWVWSGDAYQSYFVNYYLAFDKEIVKRTIRILRGSEPMTKHINTISDYTFYWLCSIWDYYFYTGDKDFVSDIYEDMKEVLAFVENRLASDGMFERKPDDWVFMDWSTFDSNGPMCAEQAVLCKAYDSISKCAKLLGDEPMKKHAQARYEYIKEQINARYWCEEKGAFIDDYKSGKKNVTRHANIFAILFNLTTKERQEKIVKNVIYNKEITPITTPYFEFYELDAMCQIGDFEYMTNMLNSYWGGMLRLGATTIWEEFDPTKNGIEHYEMYGGKYEKSLCHAWGASPIYLLGKYALGVYPTEPGYQKYEVKPNLMSFKHFRGAVPTPNGTITVSYDKDFVTVLSQIDGGTLLLNGKEYEIKANEELKVNLN